jgi:orotidine-5'-phosphate decarboxylase
MFELVIALDKVADKFESEHYGGLIKDLKSADGFKITPAAFMNDFLLDALYWWDQYAERSPYIMADFKLADVGVKKNGRWVGTNSEIIKSTIYRFPDIQYFTCHGFPGEQSVQEAVDTAKEFGAEILLITNMTHEGSQQFMTFPEYFDEMIRLGEKCGVGGYIVPGNDSPAIQRAFGMTDKEIWSPGFGRQVSLRGEPEISIKEQVRGWQSLLLPWKPDVTVAHKAIVGSYIIDDDEPEKRALELKAWVWQMPIGQ